MSNMFSLMMDRINDLGTHNRSFTAPSTLPERATRFTSGAGGTGDWDVSYKDCLSGPSGVVQWGIKDPLPPHANPSVTNTHIAALVDSQRSLSDSVSYRITPGQGGIGFVGSQVE